jgi:hypothetical protein
MVVARLATQYFANHIFLSAGTRNVAINLGGAVDIVPASLIVSSGRVLVAPEAACPAVLQTVLLHLRHGQNKSFQEAP